jgi:diguanylate cyclase
LGGEEFAVLMTNRAGYDNCLEFVSSLRGEVVGMNLFHLDNPAATMTASFGMVYCEPGTSLSMNTMVSEADTALYNAKRTGRNRVVGKIIEGEMEREFTAA